MTAEVRPITASDKERWLVLWQGYLDFYKTAVAPEQTERTWNRIMDPEFNMKCAVAESDGLVIGLQHITYRIQPGPPMDIAISKIYLWIRQFAVKVQDAPSLNTSRHMHLR